MLFITEKASRPAHFISCGNLVSENGFLHMNRTLEEFVWILVQEGELAIFANEKEYRITPGEFLFLLPGQNHYGLAPSNGSLSYYWTHFTFPSGTWKLTDTPCFEIEQTYLMPESGRLSDNGRTKLLFVQLLDIARRNGFRADFECSYALSTLLLELSGEIRLKHRILTDTGQIPPRIADLMEWLELNYASPLSVADIARRFGYHPAYLTSVFKKAAGCTIVEYIHKQRIQAAASLLTTPPRLTLSEISEAVGFADEKYFMKLFKRLEGMTPTAYRNAFFKKGRNLK